VHHIAASLRDTHRADDVVLGLSSLGNWGKDPTHIEKDLHQWLSTAYGIELDVYHIQVQVLSDQPNCRTEVKSLAVLLTYEVCAALYETSSAAFAKCILGAYGTDGLQKYWENALRSEWGKQHPVLKDIPPEQLCFLLPIQYHADGACVFRGKEYYIHSFSSPLTCGSSLDTKFPNSMLEKELFSDQTDTDIIAFINWCGQVLVSGEWPTRGYYKEEWPADSYRARKQGTRLMGPFTGAFCGWKGDTVAKVSTHLYSHI